MNKSYIIKTFKDDPEINDCCISPNSKLIATAAKNVKIWNLKTGKRIAVLEHGESVQSCCFSNDSKYLITSAWDGYVRIWNVRSLKFVKKMKERCSNFEYSCAISNDSKYVVSCGGDDDSVKVWDFESGKLLKVLRGHYESVYYCSISHDSKYVMCCSDDGTVRVWDLESKECIMILKAGREVYSCCFSSDSKYIVSCDDSGTILIWNFKELNWEDRNVFNTEHTYGSFKSDQASRCYISKDSKYILTCGMYEQLEVWDFKTHRRVKVFEEHKSRVKCCYISNDSKYVVSCDESGTVIVRDFESVLSEMNRKEDEYSDDEYSDDEY